MSRLKLNKLQHQNKYKLTLLITLENSCLMACVPSGKARWGKDGGPGGKETALAR